MFMGGMIVVYCWYDLSEDCIMCSSRTLLMQNGQQRYWTIVFRVALSEDLGTGQLRRASSLWEGFQLRQIYRGGGSIQKWGAEVLSS